MTTQEKIEAIKTWVVKVSPDIDYLENICDICDGTECNGLKHHTRPVRLADVLLAVRKNDYLGFNLISDGKLNIALFGTAWKFPIYQGQWNLRQDNLTLQSESTVDFIHSLIPKE